MPTPRDYFAKGWPGESAVVEPLPLHSTGGVGTLMFMAVEVVAEGGVAKVQKATAGQTNILIALDNSTAYDVVSSALMPVWTNISGKIIVTPHVDLTALGVGDQLEVQGAGLLVKKASAAAVGKVLALTTDGVRVLLY